MIFQHKQPLHCHSVDAFHWFCPVINEVNLKPVSKLSWYYWGLRAFCCWNCWICLVTNRAEVNETLHLFLSDIVASTFDILPCDRHLHMAQVVMRVINGVKDLKLRKNFLIWRLVEQRHDHRTISFYLFTNFIFFDNSITIAIAFPIEILGLSSVPHCSMTETVSCYCDLVICMLFSVWTGDLPSIVFPSSFTKQLCWNCCKKLSSYPQQKVW